MPPRFICTSVCALLDNTERQCRTGDVSPRGRAAVTRSCFKSHDVYTQKTHESVCTGSALTATESCHFCFRHEITLQVLESFLCGCLRWGSLQCVEWGKKSVCRATHTPGPDPLLRHTERESHSNSCSVVQPRNLLFHFPSSDRHKGPSLYLHPESFFTGFLGRTIQLFKGMQMVGGRT